MKEKSRVYSLVTFQLFSHFIFPYWNENAIVKMQKICYSKGTAPKLKQCYQGKMLSILVSLREYCMVEKNGYRITSSQHTAK